MSRKKIGFIILLSVSVFSLWTFVITLFLQQDNTVPIKAHEFSQTEYVAKEIPSKQLVGIDKQVSSKKLEAVIDLEQLAGKDNKISIDTILASLNKE